VVSRPRRRPSRLESCLLALLDERAPGKTICPSEVARAAGGADWRELMDAVRDAAWRLQATGTVSVLKGGRPVSRARARGPLRIMLRAPADPPVSDA
jgi:hypothetical protein